MTWNPLFPLVQIAEKPISQTRVQRGANRVQNEKMEIIGHEQHEPHRRMDGWVGGGMWLWTVIGVPVVVLLVVAITKLSKK